MWALNSYFFVLILAAIRTGEVYSLIPLAIVYAVLSTMLDEINYED